MSNLNNHNIISCTHEDNEDSDSPINGEDNEDYSTCFTNTKDKFVEIDTANKKCHIYTTLDCKNNDNKGKGQWRIQIFQIKLFFTKRFRDILFKLPDAPAEQITILSNYINILNDNNTNVSVLSNRQHFRGDISTINDSLKTNINDLKHLNINDTFCCSAEHLWYHDYILIPQLIFIKCT